MTPLKDLIQIQLDVKNDKTQGGLYLAKEAWETPPNTGEIIAVGPDVVDFKPKDRVLFNAYAVMQVKTQTDTYNLIKQKDLLGML